MNDKISFYLRNLQHSDESIKGIIILLRNCEINKCIFLVSKRNKQYFNE
jgi:hypothetical protein